MLMPNLSNLKESLKESYGRLRSDAYLTLYSALSIVYIYQFFNYNILLGRTIDPNLTLFILDVSFFSAIFFLILGAILDQFFRKKVHLLWNLIGALFATIIFIPLDGMVSAVLFAILGGFSASLAIPGIISKIIGITTFENRGSTAGLFIFFVYALVFSTSIFINSAYSLAIVLITIKLINAALVILRKPKDATNDDAALMAPFAMSSKLAFLAVWGIFLLVDILASNSASQLLPKETLSMIVLQSIALGFASMLLGGWLMDHYGRKKLMVYSYAYLGIEYAIISVTRGGIIAYTFIDGIAWGILSVLFIMVLWGDIIRERERPIYISIAFSITIASLFFKNFLSLSGINLSIDQTFPSTSIFLFFAVILTLFLPETLPDKIMHGKELKDYLEQAKKIKEKFK